MSALDVIRMQGVVAIVRSSSPEAAATAVETLLRAGLRAVEVSLVTARALEIIRDAVKDAPEGARIGVGTVLRESEVEAAAEAGASFIVSPVLNLRVVSRALQCGMDVLPGVSTPTEALTAIDAGARSVKLFPASLWSPDVLREVRAALPWLETVPTGGVTPHTAPDWIRAGAVAVGIGSALTQAQDPTGAAEALLSNIAEARTLQTGARGR